MLQYNKIQYICIAHTVWDVAVARQTEMVICCRWIER